MRNPAEVPRRFDRMSLTCDPEIWLATIHVSRWSEDRISIGIEPERSNLRWEVWRHDAFTSDQSRPKNSAGAHIHEGEKDQTEFAQGQSLERVDRLVICRFGDGRLLREEKEEKGKG